MWTSEGKLAAFLVSLAIAIAVFSVWTAHDRPLTDLENALLQTFTLFSGLAGSFIFGKISVRKAAKEIIKPHARSAFRRLLSLYESLSRVGREIAESREGSDKMGCEVTLARLDAIVIEQLVTADDALEDWRDIVPEDVDELKARLTVQKEEGM